MVLALTTLVPLRARDPMFTSIPAENPVPRMLIAVAVAAHTLGGLTPVMVGRVETEGVGHGVPFTVRVSAVLPWFGPLPHWSVPVIEKL
jgi:hypothetical protein